jgi:TPR repeat protein
MKYIKTVLQHVCLLLIVTSSQAIADAPLVNPFTILLEHAKKGNPDAMFEVGKYYASGEYTEQDWQKSLYWYQEAVANNHPRAMLYLGRVLLTGVEGVKADVPRAIQLIEQAASTGEAEAQYQLGQLFEEGQGVEQDLPNAIRWYREASQQKYPGAKKSMQRCIAAFKQRSAY